MLGGLFGRKAPAANQQANGGAMPDCAQIASMPNAPVTLEACQKMTAAQQQYQAAASDPSAARPGDEQMSCAQIMAEMQQQQISAPDKGKVAAAQTAVLAEQSINAKQAAEAAKQQAKDQAEVDAASAVDRATELATMGVVRGRALEHTEKMQEVEHQEMKERMAKERNPTDQKMIGTTADVTSDVASQLAANPRLARLVQLAGAHHCKGH
jgi:hypothetical protein